MKFKKSKLIKILIFFMITTGCALVKPDRKFDEVTPIDWGLENAFESSITVVPFKAQDDTWGIYAAQRMKEYLLEKKAFKRIVYDDKNSPNTPYVLEGEIEHIFYGGTNSPSEVYLTVRVVDRSDGHTRFMRKVRASSEKDAFHVNWMMRVYVPSPYPEELLNALLIKIAGDIAERTKLPSKKCP